MTKVRLPMRQALFKLLTPHATLNPKLFDEQQKLYPHLRQRLLDIGMFLFNFTVRELEGFQLDDIYIYGSSVGYFYDENSDIDLRVKVSNQSNPYIVKEGKSLDLFLRSCFVRKLSGLKFEIEGIRVDFSVGHTSNVFHGKYSLLEDKWILLPDKDLCKDLDKDEIMEEYAKKFFDIRYYMWEMVNTGRIVTKEGIEELEAYYDSLTNTLGKSLRFYIIYKMLKTRGILTDVKNLYNSAVTELLSLRDEDSLKHLQDLYMDKLAPK